MSLQHLVQFVHLLLNNESLRTVIDTITSKVVLILGRFTPDRKAVLDAIRKELRNRNYSPIVFDFELPESRDIDETVNLLARMARFIVADLTEPRSIPQELKGIIESSPSIPVRPIIHSSQKEYGMFEHLARYNWVIAPLSYSSSDDIVNNMNKDIIEPAEKNTWSVSVLRSFFELVWSVRLTPDFLDGNA